MRPRLLPSEIWDRFFWSLMVVIFVALVWMTFLQDTLRFEDGGYLVAFAVGAFWFVRGTRRLRRSKET